MPFQELQAIAVLLPAEIGEWETGDSAAVEPGGYGVCNQGQSHWTHRFCSLYEMAPLIKERIVFSSGSQSTALGSGAHPALPALVVSRPITQVIEKGEEGSQFLYRITWPRTGQAKSSAPTQPLYE
ncbi:unnamed protein product [Euphydryas editha]|uniref:Uncharacterized protein n=1 Tax=Euphydryas editha TaxID=104508 RepID=A0AAU9U120_EUPED|nr:unnamed protein product [Euphydryas editha]